MQNDSQNWRTSYHDIQDVTEINDIQLKYKLVDMQINQAAQPPHPEYIQIYVTPETNLAQLTPQASISPFTRQAAPGWETFLAEAYGNG